MQEQFAHALRVVVEIIASLVLGNVDVVQENFASFN